MIFKIKPFFSMIESPWYCLNVFCLRCKILLENYNHCIDLMQNIIFSAALIFFLPKLSKKTLKHNEVFIKKDVEICDISDEEKKCSHLLTKFHQFCKDKDFLITSGVQVNTFIHHFLVNLQICIIPEILNRLGYSFGPLRNAWVLFFRSKWHRILFYIVS